MKAQPENLDLFAGMEAAGDHAERTQEGWLDMAAEKLTEYFRASTTGATIEQAREDLQLESPTDERAWGAVVNRLSRRNVIRKVGYAPARSSHGSPKPVWKAVL